MKILLWIVGPDITLGKKALAVLRRLYGEIEIIGITGREQYPVDFTDEGYCGGFIDIDVAKKNLSPDFILMTGNPVWPFGYSTKDICTLGGDATKGLLDRVICMPGFSVEKYERLKNSRLSILSVNCFGGIISHTLDMPFLSPTINMFFEPFEAWLDMLESPDEYLSSELIFQRMAYNEADNITYPVYKLKNVEINMNHYSDCGIAEAKWYERTERINWDNIFVFMYTDRLDILERFDNLPYKKKACFVPFKSELKSAYYIDLSILNLPIWDAVNRFGYGWNDVWYYDIFDMLLDGKKTPLI